MWYVIGALAVLAALSGGMGSSSTANKSPPPKEEPKEPAAAAPSSKPRDVVNAALDVIDSIADLVNSRR